MNCNECHLKYKTYNKNSKFCSRTCYMKWRKHKAKYSPNNNGTIEQYCLTCQNKFITRLSEVKRGHGKYCSRSCSAKFTNTLRSILEPNIECSVCGIKFYRTPSLIKKEDNYCSQNCWSLVRKRVPNKDPRNTKSYRKLKIEIRQKRENKCEICGWNEAICDLHHKIAIKDGGTNIEENLILLCPNHHRLADLNILKFTSYQIADSTNEN